MMMKKKPTINIYVLVYNREGDPLPREQEQFQYRLLFAGDVLDSFPGTIVFQGTYEDLASVIRKTPNWIITCPPQVVPLNDQ